MWPVLCPMYCRTQNQAQDWQCLTKQGHRCHLERHDDPAAHKAAISNLSICLSWINFRVVSAYRKFEHKVQNSLTSPATSPTLPDSPVINIWHECDRFCEPILVEYYSSKPIVGCWVDFFMLHVVRFDKCIMVCFPYCGFVFPQISRAPLLNSSSVNYPHSKPLATTGLFPISRVLLFQNAMQLKLQSM